MTSSRVSCLVFVLAACGDNLSATTPRDARILPPTDDALAIDDAPTAARCETYPIPLVPVADGEANARAELSTLTPTATLTWNANTGTISMVLGLNLPLPGCVDGADVASQVFPVLATHAALFDLDLSEWPTPEFFNCQFADGAFVNMGRQKLAGQPFAKDIFAYALAKVGGVMTLTNAFGTYVPPAPAGTGDAMAACNTLDEAAATAVARQTAMTAATFELCNPTGMTIYTPKANDSFVLAPQAVWTWDEGTGSVLLNGQRTLRITLDPSNYTPELLGSAAKCPVGDGDDFTIGFDVTFDVHTGEILNVKPGLDCVVC